MLVCVDYETSGLDYYAPGFRVHSAAFSWRTSEGNLESIFVEGQEEVGSYISKLVENQSRVLVFNAGFEDAVTKYVYGLDLPIYCDVQRLVQQYGGLSKEDDKNISYGLEASVSRILQIKDYKKPFHNWIKENVELKRGERPGQYISMLPKDMLERYNVLDTELTFKLYEYLEKFFRREGFDWQVDHELYLKMVRLVIDAKARGIRVDRSAAAAYLEEVKQELTDLDQAFRDQFKNEIDEIILDRYQVRLAEYKSERGKNNYTWQKHKESSLGQFNCGSGTQLAELVVGRLGRKVAVWSQYDKDGDPTPEARPSFQSKLLHAWGDDLKLLATRSKRAKVKSFVETLLEKTAEDGRWHQDLRVVGTNTFRMAGGGGLNVQGIPRRDKGFMSACLAEPNYTFVSLDLISGEPTITAHYTQDKYYKMITGTEPLTPFWNSDGFFICKDIYLVGMSMHPGMRETLLEAWGREWPAGDFIAQWEVDPEVIKDYLKKTRQIAKAMVLGLGYGMGPKKLRLESSKAGMAVTLEECREMWQNYWKLYSGLRKFADSKAKQVKQKGYMYNEFGLRLTPAPHKAFNAWIQSSVNPIINLFTIRVLERAPWAEYVVIIHDETVFQVPEKRVEEFRKICQQATQDVNEILQWSVEIRTGFAAGKTLYEAK